MLADVGSQIGEAFFDFFCGEVTVIVVVLVEAAGEQHGHLGFFFVVEAAGGFDSSM